MPDAVRDPHRPTYHLMPASGWLNDPNGLGQWDGVHHAFFQHNPDEARHDRICWGHATSDDLVHWRHEPVAIRPDTGADADGCWSGVLVDDGGVPTLVYSGHRDGHLEQACLATGTPDLRTWTKHPGNPVLTPPEDLDLTVLRDHCVWREEGRWRMLMGGRLEGEGAALLFDSPDLRSWTYAATLLRGGGPTDPTDPSWPGTAWECVDLFGLDERHVLAFSSWHDDVLHHALAWVGRYEGDSFTPERLERLDLGGRAFYAPQTYRDDTGRRIMLGWLPEDRPEAACLEAGWAGVMSLPREVTLRSGGRLHQQPVAEVASLRGEELTGRVSGDALDVELGVELAEGGAVRWLVRGASYELVRRGGTATLNGGEVPLDGDRVDVRVLVDHSVVEVFANGVPLTTRSYTGVDEPFEIEADDASVTHRAWRMTDA